jgi:hydroxyacylglutathione hydrolase
LSPRTVSAKTSGVLTIEPVPCLRDNYAYLLRDPATGDVWLVDPSEAEPPARAIADRGGALRGILATHHHYDHVGGIDELVRGRDDVWVAGHASDRGRIPGQTVFVDAATDGWHDTGLQLGGRQLLGLHIPGHTRGAIAWRLLGEGGEPDDVFTGDTLFAAGCGRLFEGTPAQMYASLQQLTALPPATRLWFGHEYTAANLRFAAHVEPANEAIAKRAARLSACTTPTTVANERATNPFVRAGSVEELARRRQAKDEYRG